MSELEAENRELAATNDELRRANEALHFALERYRALHDLAPVPLVTIDPHGVILDANRSAEALLETSRDELRERRFAQLVAEARRAAVPDILTELFVTGSLQAVELALVAGPAAVEVVLDGVVHHEAEGAHAVLALVDLTAQRQAEEARRAAEEAQRHQSLGVLASGIAHDFNNLLAVVLAGADHTLDALGSESPHAETLLDVRRAARHAGDLARQMLAYSGQVSAPARPLDLGELLRELEPLIRASTKASPIAMRIAKPSPWITGDAAQLRQVVLNLAVNAAEALEGRPGAIAIALEVQQPPRTLVIPGAVNAARCAVIEVRDDGIGMDAATVQRVFEPYFSTKFTGRGLGLAVVHGIVRGHGGALTVESVPGEGTTFRVYFAEVPAPQPAPSVEGQRVAAAGTGTMLLVDDDPQVQRMLARIASGLGIEVIAASGGAEAIELFRAASARIDLVLTDLTMPGLNGIAVAKAIRAASPSVPIVLVTGYGELPAEAGELFAGVIAKPFSLADIRTALGRFLPGSR